MNEQEWRDHQARVKREIAAVQDGIKRAVDNFRHFWEIESDPVILEHQVAKAFEQGVQLGKKIANKKV